MRLENGAFVKAFLFATFPRDMKPAVLAGGRLVINDATHFVTWLEKLHVAMVTCYLKVWLPL